ncbi:spore coat protein [Alkalihalophilus lindianensis]|uniref:Spore coat protein n=1 Tax=Alkalihalophilus lindianensis TaxID=1630542 RepID=A0ABU3X9P2_9BACI|nr:spore coat protein [Alkalihalophilus lindianensis]MDV2684596.1 spore coat protein [Alkalihalophilus lindianensis]
MNQQQPTGTIQSNQLPQNMSHGGHEVFDAHEILAEMINVMDQYMMFRSFMKDQELIDILDRQYQFLESQYNLAVDAFSTGSKPAAESTDVYKMTQSNDVVFGLTPSQPKKPNRSISEIKEAGLSAHMLGLLKTTASTMAMTAVEMTNPVLRRIMADTVPNMIEMAYEVFLYQNKHGYYQVPQLKQQDMQMMTQAFAQTTTPPQMPNATMPPNPTQPNQQITQ